MKGLGVTLGLAVLLSALLLVFTEPSLAGKQKPGKDKAPPAWGQQEQKPGKDKAPPAWGQEKEKPKGGQKARDGNPTKAPGAKDPAKKAPISVTETITLCHKPGTPAQKTLVLPAAAAAGHLQHGDYEGVCEEVIPTVPTDTMPISATQRITICHKPGTPAEKTLVLPAAAVPGHLRHGDYEGACEEEVTPTVPTGASPLGVTETITVCHKPGTPAQKTLVLPATALFAHMQHGDEQGACPDTAGPVAAHYGGWRNRR